MTSIRRALIGRLVPMLLLMLAVIGAGLYLLVRQQLTADFDDALLAKARVLAGLLKYEGGQVELELDETPMPEFSRAADPEYFEIWLGHAVFRRSATLAGDTLDGAPGEEAARIREAPDLGHGSILGGHRTRPYEARTVGVVLPDGRRGRATALRFPVRVEGAPPPQPLPEAFLVVARGRAPLDRALSRVALALLIAGLGLLLSVPLVVAAGVRRGLRPLDRLAAQATRIDARTLEGRFGARDLPAELQPITARLDELLDRLAAAFERERRFSADVAHELRTPIAELRTLAEVALQVPELTDRRAFQDVLAAALQMEHLVTTLLTLARCEAGRQPVLLEPMVLDRALEEAWAPLAEKARAKGLRLERGECGITVGADRLMLSSIFGNLLGNAVAYAPAGGFVAWAYEGTELVIRNSNDTLGPADLPHVFEPFWRKDAARSDGAHGGLGLPLVAAFARLIGAEVRLELGSANDVCVHLALPGPPPAPAA